MFLKFSFHLHSGLFPALMSSVKSLRCLSRSEFVIEVFVFDKEEIIKFMFGILAVEDVVVVDDEVIAPSESICSN